MLSCPSGPPSLAGALAGEHGATSDAANAQLESEWERVRRQRIALEKQQKRPQDGRESGGNHDEDDEDEEEKRLVALQAEPSTDPCSCLCRPFKLKKLGQSYILHERRVTTRGRVSRELILVGPHWIGVVVTLSITVGCTGLFLHQQCTLLPWYYSLITVSFCTMTLYYLYGVACTDPGIVMPPSARRRVFKDDHEEKTDTALAILADDDDDDTTSKSEQRGDEEGGVRQTRVSTTRRPMPSSYSTTSPRTRVCDVCEVAQDAYTEHCDDCGVCIEDYDHHCPWMGKCIGKKNMRAFRMFNVSWILYVVFVLLVSIQTVDWGDAAVQRLHRLSTGEWVPFGTTEKPH